MPLFGYHDQWSRWLLVRRYGGDPDQRRAVLERLIPIRDRVVENARLGARDTALDVGCGDGLIGFGILGRPGFAGRVVFSDVSSELLTECKRTARRLGYSKRCEFVEAAAEDLGSVADESVDAVTLRSVLIYVADKAAAFRTFRRVLRPGGRLSLFEPLNRFAFDDTGTTFAGYDVTPVLPIARKLAAVYAAIEGPSPLADFDERDLLRLAEEAGFTEVHLELHADIEPRVAPQPWRRALDTSGNPLAPTLREAIGRALNPDEAIAFTRHLRPLVERGVGHYRMATAYLWAVRP